MADYRRQAERDANLAYREQEAAISSAIEAARRQAEQSRRQAAHEANVALQGMSLGKSRAAYELLARAAMANMGQSGFSFSGVQDMESAYQQKQSEIRSAQYNTLMQIADRLDQVLTEAQRSRQVVAKNKADLISQLIDKYRADAEARALARAQQSLAAEQLAFQKQQYADYLKEQGSQKRLAIASQLSAEANALLGRIQDGSMPYKDAVSRLVGIAQAYGDDRVKSAEDLFAYYGNILPSQITRPAGSLFPLGTTSQQAGSGSRAVQPTTALGETALGAWRGLRNVLWGGLVASPVGLGVSTAATYLGAAHGTPAGRRVRVSWDDVWRNIDWNYVFGR